MKKKILIDTNLLVLLIVGMYDPQHIGHHKRLSDYVVSDYELLTIILEGAEVIVTSACLAEANSLLWQTSPPHDMALRDLFRSFVAESVEFSTAAAQAVASKYFLKLGFTDAGILQIEQDFATILTVDLDLHLAALELKLPTENFNNYRDFR